MVSAVPHDLAALESALEVSLPSELRDLYCGEVPASVSHLFYRPVGDPSAPPHVLWALDLIRQGVTPSPRDLIPIMPVDDGSLACVASAWQGHEPPEGIGTVVRWHLTRVPSRAQRQILDTGPRQYVETMAATLRSRDAGLAIMQQIAAEYEQKRAQGRHTKRYEAHPIRLAVQNVILGLAAIRQDSTHNALAVDAWQACEAPHVNAHEGVRGLLAMTLTEAFRAGGTMEIRFHDHPERAVPSALRQFARCCGIDLGTNDPASISPAEARELFYSVTHMPAGLRERVDAATRSRSVSPERACFVLLAKVWSAIELDVLLGLSERADSILRGGVDPLQRTAAQAELEACRAALMVGMLWEHLRVASQENDTTATVVEDDRVAVYWRIDVERGGVALRSDQDLKIPWSANQEPNLIPAGTEFVVLPRTFVVPRAEPDLDHRGSEMVATLEPRGVRDSHDNPRGPVIRLVCPESLTELDATVEGRLLKCRVGRA